MATNDREDFKFPDEKEQENDKQETAAVEESDIELEVIDDTPEEDRGFTSRSHEIEDPTDEEVAEYSQKVQKRIKELSYARQDERRAKEAAIREREEAARLAQQLLEENRKLRESYNAGAQSLSQLASSKAEMELQVARQKLKEAQESYDTDQIIAAQEELAAARYRVEQAKTFTPPSLQPAKTEIYSQPTQQQSAATYDPKAARWQAQNQWFGQDDEMTSLALAVHKKLVESGVDPRTDAYYERIDARLREVFPDFFGETRKEPKRPATVVAAPTRTASKKVAIKLTKTQEVLAKRLGLTNEQYAREVLKLNSES